VYNQLIMGEPQNASGVQRVMTTVDERLGGAKLFLLAMFGIAFYGGIALALMAWFGNQWAQARFAEIGAVARDRPWETLAGLILLVAFAIVSARLHALIRTLPDDLRRTVVGFVAVGVILLLVLTVVFLHVAYRRFAEQIAFFFVASLLPGALYYLVLRTRRPSILNEFTMNLWRLGYLRPRRAYLRHGNEIEERCESDEDRVNRVDAYFQKFEAVYGALRFEGEVSSRTSYVEAILQDSEGKRRRVIQPTVRLADILTANIFIPLGFATFLAALGWLLVLEPDWAAAATAASGTAAQLATERGLEPIRTSLNFAFLGAYFFGVQSLFRRFVRRDLGPNAFLAFSNRIILSVIGIWVIATSTTLLSGPYSLLVAFIVGVFPRTVWQVMSAAATSVAKFVIPSVEAKQPLDDLDGLTIWHQSRLEEEDIENVPNMATADIVDLVLHTQIPAERLVDWIDQAILYKALGPETEQDFAKTRRGKLRNRGIRTATQLVRVYVNADDAERLLLERTLEDAQNPGVLRTIVEAIQTEANWDPVAAWRNVVRPYVELRGVPIVPAVPSSLAPLGGV
jgi:hypothetical protein